MGFGKRLRKRVSHIRKAVTAPVRKALTPIVGKNLATVISDPGAKVVSALHPITTAIGKFDAVAYGTIGGGLVGAAITRRSGNTSVFGGTGVNTIAPAAIQIEKPLLGVAGGLIAGGIGSGIAGAVGDAIVGGDTGVGGSSGRNFDSFVGADTSPAAAAGGSGTGWSSTLVVLIGLGGLSVVALLVAFTKRR